MGLWLGSFWVFLVLLQGNPLSGSLLSFKLDSGLPASELIVDPWGDLLLQVLGCAWDHRRVGVVWLC